MAYMYQIEFDIRPTQMSELQIGAALQRVLGYLRTLLPGQPGFMTARAMYSMDIPDRTHLLFESQWERWDDLISHRKSRLAEDKVLQEFQPHVKLEDLQAHTYAEVG